MKKKQLTREIIFSLAAAALLPAGQVCMAEEVDHNIALTGADDYRTYDSLTVKVDATGDIYQNNYEDKGYENNVYPNSAVIIWNKNQLMVNGPLHIEVVPAPWPGSKIDMGARQGIPIQSSGGSMVTEGDAFIKVDNYTHTDDFNGLEATDDPDLDYGLDSQQGIYLDGQDASAKFKENLTIEMSDGNRSMGIYATAGASVDVAGNTDITVKNAPYYTYGISNYYNDQRYNLKYSGGIPKLNFLGDLTITTKGGNNSIGINLKSNSLSNAGAIKIGGNLKIHSSGAEEYTSKTDHQEFPDSVSNYGIYFYQIKEAEFNTADITASSKKDDETYEAGAESIGIYNYMTSDMTFHGDASVTADAGEGDTEIAVLARNASQITFEKGLKATGETALNASGKWNGGSSILVNSTKSADAEVQISGNIVVGKTDAAMIWGADYDAAVDKANIQNTVTANFLNADSFYTGINEFGNEGGFDQSAGEINLYFANQAKWNMTGSTDVTNLQLDRGGLLDMTYGAGTAQGFRTLHAKNLSGDGGIIHINVDAGSNVNNSDRLFVDELHTGTQYITLNNVGTSTEQAEGTILASVNEEKGAFKANDSEGTLYWNRYDLAKEASTTAGYTYDWVLAAVAQIEDRPTATVQAALGANALNYHTWRAETDQLMRRMGELRQNGGDDAGIWFRLHGSKISRNDAAGFENEYTSYELGYDRTTKQTADMTRYTGVAVSYTDGDGRYYSGNGENHSTAVSLYNTDIYESGHYLDLVFKLAHMDNDFHVYDSNGTRVDGDYENTGLSFSAEYGRRSDLGGGWYIEPQVQMTVGHINGDDYETSNGVSVKQEGIWSLLGRAGFNIGRTVGDRGILYAKASVLHEFGGDYTLRMYDSTGASRIADGSFDDTWFEYGIGAALRLNENSHFYFDILKTAGGDFEKEWAWNAGMRWTF